MTGSHPVSRTLLVALGIMLLLLAAAVSPLPGPGGIFFVAGGLILILRNSAWARRRFTRWRRSWPRLGALLDRAMRRPSARRRRVRAEELPR
ncbi:MAG TPA: hypothetical protein VF592_07750 [Sphingomonas sp.]|jgi:hypothetical protein|uniref:hypothetical protein n=1 Tax=Sphingomonas sp. TaxID=28214 RepID=UPI002ED78F20